MMKILKLLPATLLVIVAVSFSNLEVQGQEKTFLPLPLHQTSSLAEILSWLDKNAFPYAQIGLRADAAHTQSVVPFKSGNPVPAQERIFSEGFHVTSVTGCQVILSNEHVKIVDARNPSSGTFHRFITQKNANRELTPQLAQLFLPLDKISESKGKGPSIHTEDRNKTKLLKPWRTTFDEKGFFRHSIFQMELNAEEPQPKELGNFGHLSFSFDSKELAEQFDAAFRRAIRLCAHK